MAVVPKHKDSNARYDPRQDFTDDQRQRFTKVANTAQKRKEEFEQRFSAIEKARKAAVKPVVKVNKEKPNSVRYAVWLVMAGVIALWFMYMTGGA
ncbi:hypothetical protein [Vibrio mexicanus]|uniref:hypothetical protein n=1 Tax=Vibrio mexicanus TaxID=1004326 RepID=UPI00063CDB82|nr:hypothetical protein [Vibrio mexicanus]